MSISPLSIPDLPKEVSFQLWKIDEEVDYFKENLPSFYLEDILKRTNIPQKLKESLACRLLLFNSLKSLQIPLENIQYDSSGKPNLKNGIHFSFSHTKKFAACALSEKYSVGVDIEATDRPIEKIAPRFLSEDEQLVFNSQKLKLLSWTMKEAIYKAAGYKGLGFREGIKLIENKNSFLGEVYFEEKISKFDLFYFQNEMLTIALAIVNHPKD
jgi:phosphopantetheinyl transferase